MSWKDGLLQASYKGVPFAWVAQTGRAGRRLAEHEYPQRDQPYIEDMGRITRPFAFEAVIGGPTWQADLDALLAVLEEPGAGELVHPLWGAVMVYPRPCEWRLDLGEGRVVRLSLEFIEAGQLAYPVASANTGAQLGLALDGWQGELIGGFESALSLIDRGRAQVDEVLGALDAYVLPVRASLRPLCGAAIDLSSLVGDVLGGPRAALSGVVGLFDDVRNAWGLFTGLTRHALGRGEAARVLAHQVAAVPPPQATPSQRVAGALVQTLAPLLVLDAARAAAELPVAGAPSRPPVRAALDPSAEVDLVDVPVASDVAAARQAIGDALWQLALVVPPADCRRLQALRHATHAHLVAVERAGRRVVEWTPPEVLPAVVAAYRAHGDARRADDLVARNGVRHPLFVPVQPLQIPL